MAERARAAAEIAVLCRVFGQRAWRILVARAHTRPQHNNSIGVMRRSLSCLHGCDLSITLTVKCPFTGYVL